MDCYLNVRYHSNRVVQHYFKILFYFKVVLPNGVSTVSLAAGWKLNIYWHENFHTKNGKNGRLCIKITKAFPLDSNQKMELCLYMSVVEAACDWVIKIKQSM